MSEPLIFRANIKTASSHQYKFAIARHCFGFGWPVAGGYTGMNWSEYLKLASKQYATDRSWKRFLLPMHNNLAPGDFVWTRDEDANFYLGRIASKWQYVAEKENIEADLFNVWECDWTKPLTLGQIPGSLMLCRGSYRQLKSDEGGRITEYTKMLYAKIKGQPYLGSSLHSLPDLFRWISYSSCEDLVALYLQHKGYSIIPSTNKKSTAEYEFELVHRDTGSVAAVQVKNGKTSLDCLKYAAVPFKVYLFTSEGQYLNSESRPQNVEIVDRETLVAFADECRHMLPDTIRLWVEYLKP